MMRLHKILLTLVCFTVLSAHAQWKWLNPLECGFPVIQNQGWTEEIGDRYVRLLQRRCRENHPTHGIQRRRACQRNG